MPESISRKIRISNLSLAAAPPAEPYISIGYVIIDTPQQFSGSIVVSKTELKKLNVMVGDELSLALTTSER